MCLYRYAPVRGNPCSSAKLRRVGPVHPLSFDAMCNKALSMNLLAVAFLSPNRLNLFCHEFCAHIELRLCPPSPFYVAMCVLCFFCVILGIYYSVDILFWQHGAWMDSGPP
uniref:Uncharacterized protein n=1 Tax=Odontella aurita TaxID=265563 RepID=A0A7S4K1W7_9STRA|mmetsp:Transcript_59637/g.176765  ORF Transcript_59637/g.176765 Transcript_59637/m.176765 type:complete len:111 (+) Transcript_59637:106-438(+)